MTQTENLTSQAVVRFSPYGDAQEEAPGKEYGMWHLIHETLRVPDGLGDFFLVPD